MHKSELLGERAVIIFINLAIKPCPQFVTLMVNYRISLRTGDCVCFDGIDPQVCSVPDIIKVKVPVCFFNTILESKELGSMCADWELGHCLVDVIGNTVSKINLT